MAKFLKNHIVEKLTQIEIGQLYVTVHIIYIHTLIHTYTCAIQKSFLSEKKQAQRDLLLLYNSIYMQF